MVWAPSSATLLAAPGSSISRSTSIEFSSFKLLKFLSPSSRTSFACLSFSSFVLNLFSSANNSWTSFSCSLINFFCCSSFSFFFCSWIYAGVKVSVAPSFRDSSSCCAIWARACLCLGVCFEFSLYPMAWAAAIISYACIGSICWVACRVATMSASGPACAASGS